MNILCIDDIESNLFTIKSVLESPQVGYNIFTALSAHEGFDILLKEKIDLILLDVMMPEVDGYVTAKMILSNKRSKDIPIIFVTAKKDDETIEKCYMAGGHDYISKPFNDIELLNRVAFHIKLKDKDRQLRYEKEYTQSILDLQDNIIIVTDGKKALHVNQALLNFYNLNSLEEFQDKYLCVNLTFIKEDGYFPLNSINKDILWIENVIKESRQDDVLVKITHESHNHIFNVKATHFEDRYIVTLSDVTHLTKQSLSYQHEANYDTLTKIYNRNMLYRLLDRKITQAKLNNTSFSFIMLDIDFFKKVNDTYGHLAGDNILKSVTKLIKNHIREKDIFARWGGEEFVLVLDVSLEKAVEISDNLRSFIEKKVFDDIGTLTCSFGVTYFKSDDQLSTMMLRADKALYEAKSNGRNQVCQDI